MKPAYDLGRGDIAPAQSDLDKLLKFSAHEALSRALRYSKLRAYLPSLKAALAALIDDRLDIALREIDRLWRQHPELIAVIAPVYARILSLEDREHDAKLRVLKCVAIPDSDLAALEIYCLLKLDRISEAREALGTALSTFCVEMPDLLSQVAITVIDQFDSSVGWIARNHLLEFVGGLRKTDGTSTLHIRFDTGEEFSQPIKTFPSNGHQYFSFKLPLMLLNTQLTVSSHGVLLFGGSCPGLPEFGVDGRAIGSDRTISGWVSMRWRNRRPLLMVQDEFGNLLKFECVHTPLPDGRYQFKVDLRRAKILGHRLNLYALLPTGKWQTLPGMPFLLKEAACLPGNPRKHLLARWITGDHQSTRFQTPRHRRAIEIIVPVYRGKRQTLDCIGAALTTAPHARVVVVDDATDDAELADSLRRLEADGRIVLLRNTVNLGFVGSANRALTRDRIRDVVLLNSDAVVFGNWLERLQSVAYSAPHIGTVTPFSNSGSIASYPRNSQDPLSIEDASKLDAIASRTNAGLSEEIPVGVGFCLYIKRACLDENGLLDASVFGKGYGEETDFCLRARRKGWSHRLAADVFVYHGGGRSFGTQRDALLHRSQRLLNLRHPGFNRYIADFESKDPIRSLRRRLDQQRIENFTGQFVLLVTLALDGGVSRFVTERCRALRTEGRFPLVLRPNRAGSNHRCELWTDALDVPNLVYNTRIELHILKKLLENLNLATIEIQHFLDLDSRVIDMVLGIGIPYDVVLHDYSWICPRVTLIDGKGQYCGEPAVSVCEKCITLNGTHLSETISVAALRQRSNRWLKDARRVAAPSADAAARLSRYFDKEIQVRPHRNFHAVAPIKSHGVASHDGTRVVLIGAIGEHKGYSVLLNCARDAKARTLPLEFIVVGYTKDDATLLKTGNVFITGRFGEGEAAHLLAREQPDIIFMPSVWPETWCYALDEALGTGLPIVAFDLGAIAERLRTTNVGTVLPLGCKPSRINDQLMELRTQRALAASRDMAIIRQIKEKKIDNPPAKTVQQQDGFSASVQFLPLTAGLYLFSVTAATTSVVRSHGELRVPAMHVGLGPGVPTGQVEFITGPTTDGAWLFAKEDCLVTRVTGATAMLVLTSVRAPGGETLSIKVERLDVRTATASTAMSTAAPPISAKSATASFKRTEASRSKATAAPQDTSALFEISPLSIQIGAHIRSRGDMTFSDLPWAGRIAPGLWIESFSVKPLEHFEAHDIEYKGLTGSGFETPWLSDGVMCGTKGMAVPLVGFAIRLKPSSDASAYECEYSGYFKSGAIIGPLRNGAPCRSTVANDPLEGIQIHLVRRATIQSSTSRHLFGVNRIQGPSFGRYRDGAANGADAIGALGKTAATSIKPKAKTTAKRSLKTNINAPAKKRSAARRP